MHINLISLILYSMSFWSHTSCSVMTTAARKFSILGRLSTVTRNHVGKYFAHPIFKNTVATGKRTPRIRITTKEDDYDDQTTTEIPAHPFCSKAPEIIPSNVTQTATIIFLHEFGQTGIMWTEDMVQIRQPYMKAVCPTADNIPISWQHKLLFYGWFDFRSRGDPMAKEDVIGLNKSITYVHDLINEEVKHGIKPERIILGGFSQGASLALHAALSYPQRLGGLIAFNLWKPNPKTLEKYFNKVNKNIPIFHGHASKNIYMTDDAAKEIAAGLKKDVSNKVQFKIYEGYHIITDEEIVDANKFCKRLVKPLP